MKLDYIMEATKRRFCKDLDKTAEEVLDKGFSEYYIGTSFDDKNDLASFYGLDNPKALLECVEESHYLQTIRRRSEEYGLGVIPKIISFDTGRGVDYVLELLVTPL